LIKIKRGSETQLEWAEPDRRKLVNLLIYLAFVLAGLTTVFKLADEIGTLTDPGPGLWPIVLGVILCAFSCYAAYNYTLPEVSDDTDKDRNYRKPLLVVCLLICYGFIFLLEGIFANLFFLLVYLRIISGYKSSKCICYSFIGSFALWVLFSALLKVPFPSLFD